MIHDEDNAIRTELESRARWLMFKCLPALRMLETMPDLFFIAGNSMNKVPGDIDLFPWKCKWPEVKDDHKPAIVTRSKNATTVRTDDDVVVQFCNYEWDRLDHLLGSFDYAHIQVGAAIATDDTDLYGVDAVSWTDDWLRAQGLNTSWYIGSGYPLSSLVRVTKYRERRQIDKRRSLEAVIGAVADVVERGFKDYEDFKDQLDAVDLGIVPEYFPDCTGDLMRLFELLRKDKS